MNCALSHAVHTIGHSTRTGEVLIELLNAHSIELLIDVRRWPASRRYPRFNRESLGAALKTRGIDYLWCGDLGGFRKAAADSPNTGWRVATFRAYADFMLTEEFQKIMSAMERIGAESRLALMCAEAVPWRCHRQLLADAFMVRGWSVRHIMKRRLSPASAHPLCRSRRHTDSLSASARTAKRQRIKTILTVSRRDPPFRAATSKKNSGLIRNCGQRKESL
jgi:uncharacterized protein (DUF488 family)